MSEESLDLVAVDDARVICEFTWKSMATSFREIRIARKISLRELAREIGVHSTHLSRVEKGETVPNVVFALRWAQALHLDFGRLYETSLRLRDKDAPIG